MPEHMRAYAEDPGPALEAAFRRIERERMRGVQILNQALGVRALGFRRERDGWLGVLVTPWFMNFMLLPAEGMPWTPLAEGEKRTLAFPAGGFEFIGGFERAIGEYQSCSLLSPVLEFADQEAACAVALAALDALFVPEEPSRLAAERPGAGKGLARPMSKREFLRGGLLDRAVE